MSETQDRPYVAHSGPSGAFSPENDSDIGRASQPGAEAANPPLGPEGRSAPWALVERARREHPPSAARHTCLGCGKDYPCLARRLAEALEEEIEAQQRYIAAERRQQETMDLVLQDVRARLARAEGERDAWPQLLQEHWLSRMQCDHAEGRDRAVCSCSLVGLGWQPNVGAAVQSWIDHARGLSAALGEAGHG